MIRTPLISENISDVGGAFYIWEQSFTVCCSGLQQKKVVPQHIA